MTGKNPDRENKMSLKEGNGDKEKEKEDHRDGYDNDNYSENKNNGTNETDQQEKILVAQSDDLTLVLRHTHTQIK